METLARIADAVAGWVRRLLRRTDHVVAQSANTIANAHAFYEPRLPITQIPLGIRRPPEVRGRRADYDLEDADLLLVTSAGWWRTSRSIS